MYRPGNKNMEDKENRRYESMEDRKVRTGMDLGIKIWRIKRTEDIRVRKIGRQEHVWTGNNGG
jgi:hypothetical protein